MGTNPIQLALKVLAIFIGLSFAIGLCLRHIAGVSKDSAMLVGVAIGFTIAAIALSIMDRAGDSDPK